MLREKVMLSAQDGRLFFIGADDFAKFVADYALAAIAENPVNAARGCGIDDVTDEELAEKTGFSLEILAAGFIGASVELAPWQGEAAIDFLLEHDVPEDAAWDVSKAVALVIEKLGARGRVLIHAIDRAPVASPLAEIREIAHDTRVVAS